MRLIAIARPEFRPLKRLESEAPGVEVTIGNTAEELRGAAVTADAILIQPRFGSVLVELWRDLKNVRWIHSLAAGVDKLPFDLLRGSDAIVTNSRGIYADSLSEFVIAAILWFAKDLRRLVRNQEQKKWEPFTVERVEGRCVGIIGYGGIGQAVGRRAEGLGMKVIAVRRQQEFGDPTVDEAMREADYVVLSTPLTPSTHRMITRERLQLMQPGAVLVNVSRGPVVDEAALIEALQDRRIRGAALDVFETEPLPETSPLWTLDNVLLSPHTADHTSDSHDRAMSFFFENLRRFRNGEPLENVVDKAAMY